MRVIDALHQPWAIRPETLQTVLEVYERHALGEKPDFAAIEAAIGKPLKNEPKPYEVIDGVAVLNVVGVLGKRFDMFMAISGGASTQRLQGELAAALNDATAHSILLYIDSPGGEVDGTQALANDVFNARGQKPIVALGDGAMASAAYWIGAAADSVYVASGTTLVGSIGIVATHTDVSKAQEKRGVKTTELAAGKYKRIASQYAPLTAEGQQSIQDTLDAIYSVFVDDVAKYRGTDSETVLKDMADGRLFVGQQAVDAGLVDGFASLGELIAQLNANQAGTTIGLGARAPISPHGGHMDTKITAEQLEAAKAEALTLGKSEGHAAGLAIGKTEGKAEGIAEGAKTERERIQAVEAQALPGHDKLIATLKFDGKTSGPEAAVAVLKAEREAQGKVKADLKSDAPAPVTQIDPPTSQAVAEPDPVQVANKAKIHIAEQKKLGINVSLTEAVNKVRSDLGLK